MKQNKKLIYFILGLLISSENFISLRGNQWEHNGIIDPRFLADNRRDDQRHTLLLLHQNARDRQMPIARLNLVEEYEQTEISPIVLRGLIAASVFCFIYGTWNLIYLIASCRAIKKAP